jgi:regulator of protease activity HflC (stomatin/prohibitin superfamily)
VPRGPQQGLDPSKVYRLAFALRAAGERQEATQALEAILTRDTAFPERAAAERMLAELKEGR